MTDTLPSADAPTTKQTLIVALAMGVVAAGGGGALGYILGGQTIFHNGEKSTEIQETVAVPPEKIADATHKDTSVEHEVSDHGETKGHGSAATATGSKHLATNTHKRTHVEWSKLTVRELSPIVTNLADPANNWIRLQSAIVFNPEDLSHPEKMIAELTGYITGYLRTVTLTSLEGADGLRRLQEELSERAMIRSNGKIHEFIVETMVVQ